MYYAAGLVMLDEVGDRKLSRTYWMGNVDIETEVAVAIGCILR